MTSRLPFEVTVSRLARHLHERVAPTARGALLVGERRHVLEQMGVQEQLCTG